MPQSIIAAVAAMHVVHDKQINLSRYEEFITKAAAQKARLLVLPEASLQGFLFHPDIQFDPEESAYHWEQAETVPGPSTTLIANWAAEQDIYIIFGLLERVDYPSTPVLYNSSVLVGPHGYIGTFRKVHQPSEELLYYRPGRDWPVFETAFGHIGMMICYDMCFPEAARVLTLRGADILVISSAWSKGDQGSIDRYQFFARARAAENNRWVLQSNQVGPSDKQAFEYLGCSRIIAPNGFVVAETPMDQEGLALSEIELVKLDPRRYRSGWYLLHRRPETYSMVTDLSQNDNL